MNKLTASEFREIMAKNDGLQFTNKGDETLEHFVFTQLDKNNGLITVHIERPGESINQYIQCEFEYATAFTFFKMKSKECLDGIIDYTGDKQTVCVKYILEKIIENETCK